MDPTNSEEYYKHLSLFWTDLVHLMSSKPQALTSVGPMRNYAENSKRIAVEMIESAAQLKEFSDSLLLYYKQLADTWFDAQKKVNAKMPQVPQDAEQFEAYKRIWVDILDNDFTELFDSKRFGENYGKLVAQEMELANHWNNVTDVLLKSANLPSKKEIDEMYRQMHDLKKRVSVLESQLLFRKESKADGVKAPNAAVVEPKISGKTGSTKVPKAVAEPKVQSKTDGAKAPRIVPKRQGKTDGAKAPRIVPKRQGKADGAGASNPVAARRSKAGGAKAPKAVSRRQNKTGGVRASKAKPKRRRKADVADKR
jgi:hypothetical protein